MKKESLSGFPRFDKIHKRQCLFIVKIIMILLVFCNSAVFAKTKEKENKGTILLETQQEPVRISGVVSDEIGPMTGVSVTVKGTQQGTVTDLDGRFSISAPNNNAVLTFSFIGYTSMEVPVKNKTNWNIIMKEDAQLIDEVVVVGYGTQKKVNLTGSVAAVKIDENLASRSLTNVSSGLSGLVPGLTVMQTSGFAGFDGAGLKIRGLGSVNGDSKPLVVVDGMPDVDINRINMNDVESISILKDAASSAVYGSRAANGVILITTRSGKDQSKAKISYTGSYGVSDATNFYDYLADYSRAMLMERRAGLTGNRSSGFKDGTIEQWMAMSLVDPILFPNTDQYDAMFRQGSVQSHNVSASGGTDKANFYLSVGLMDQKGLQINNDYDRYNMRFNMDYKIRNNISVGIRTDGQWTQTNYPRGAGLENAGLRYAVSGILNKHPETGEYGGAMAYGENSAAGNMLAEYELYNNERTRQEYNANIYGDWEIIKGLKFNIGYALRYYNQFTKSYQNVSSQWNFQTGLLSRTMPPDDGLNNDIYQGYKTLFSGSLNYNKQFNGIHNLAVMVAGTEEYWFDRYLGAGRKDRLDPSLTELDAASASQQTNSGYSDDEGLRSFIGRVNYSFKDKYLFEANFRYDGSSKFTPGHQWGFFPSAAVGWRISEEEFFENLREQVTNLKFRASYGSLGNNSGDIISRYEQKNTFATTNYILNGSIVKGFSANKMINPDLSWESSDVLNLGLDMAFLSNHLTVELDWYDRLTKGMIRGSDLSSLLSAYSAPRVNIGEMRNRGLEANITWKSKVNDFSYSVNLNASFNQNRLEKWNEYLSKGWVYLDMPYQYLYTMEAYSGLIQNWNEIYNAPYQSSQYMAPGDILIKDLNGDGQVNDEDKKAYSNRYRNDPVGQYGLNLYAAYKGFDLSALFQAATGRWDFWLDYYNETNIPADRMGFQEFHWNDTWSLDNRGATLPRLVVGGGEGGSRNRSESTYTLYDASYLRLKNLQLGYNIPNSILRKISIDRIRIYVTAENLLTYSKWPGVDPEKPKGDNADIYPLVKTYSIGINVGF